MLKGQKCSEETKKRMSESHRKICKTKDYKRALSVGVQNKYDNDLEYKKKKSVAQQELWKDKAYRDNIVTKLKVKRNTKQYKQAVSERMKKKWEDPSYCKDMFAAWDVSPNNIELRLQLLLNTWFPNQWKFVGDGKVFINGKCPDFINVNGKKLIIELFGDYWHQGGKKEERERIKVFKPYGYKTLIIREIELKDEIRLKHIIVKFTGASNGN